MQTTTDDPLEQKLFGAMRDAITAALQVTNGQKEQARFLLVQMIDTALVPKTIECGERIH